MTRYEPTLIVTRLVVERNDAVAYDERFHPGVNIIRGDNSSGKSTILNFIFYGLGGDLSDWSDVALLTTHVHIEVLLNGNPATLTREISEKNGQPMEIFGGDYETARVAPRAEWTRYPYRRSSSRESFSQALFRLLGIPEVAGDLTGNVTMHQVLRLLYADQLSPVESLFRFEQFDPPSLRDAVGRLLCGAYDSELYNNELRIRDLTREFDAATSELRSLFAILGTTKEPLTLEFIARQRRVLAEQKSKVQVDIDQIELRLFTSSAEDKLTLKAQERAYADVQRLQAELGSATSDRDALLLAIADSDVFIAALERKLAALEDSSLVAKHVGDVQFQSCPRLLCTSRSTDGACVSPLQDPIRH